MVMVVRKNSQHMLLLLLLLLLLLRPVVNGWGGCVAGWKGRAMCYVCWRTTLKRRRGC